MLAAGGSRRLGKPKQFVKYRGTSLIERAVRLALALAPARVAVVAGRERQRVRRAVGGRCPVVVNRNWDTGMRSSLKCGLLALPDSISAALILTCDQPRIRRNEVQALIERWSARPTLAVAALYSGGLGVPAILPRRYWRAVLEAAGPDQGAGPWFKLQHRKALGVPLPRADFDIDTPKDL